MPSMEKIVRNLEESIPRLMTAITKSRIESIRLYKDAGYLHGEAIMMAEQDTICMGTLND